MTEPTEAEPERGSVRETATCRHCGQRISRKRSAMASWIHDGSWAYACAAASCPPAGDVDSGTKAPTHNEELLSFVMDWIAAHPERHDQLVFLDRTECGTVGCIAGWAVLFTGWRWPGDGSKVIARDGSHWSIVTAAMDELGLTARQGEALFCGDNQLEDLARIVADIRAGRVDPVCCCGGPEEHAANLGRWAQFWG